MENQKIGENGYTANWVIDVLKVATTFGLLCEKWFELTMQLNTGDVTVNALRRHDIMSIIKPPELLKRLLDEWIGRAPNEATLGNFHLYLQNMHMNDAAQALEKAFETRAGTSSTRDSVDMGLQNSNTNETSGSTSTTNKEEASSTTSKATMNSTNAPMKLGFNCLGVEVKDVPIQQQWLIPVILALLAVLMYKILFW